MTALEFLNLLWQYKPEELYVLIWTLKNKSSHWFQDVAAAAQFVEQARGIDLYVGTGLAAGDRGPHHRCASDDIAGSCGLTTDLDLLSDAHSKKALPRTLPEALSVLPASMPPTITVNTGNGAHAWWLLKEPEIFASDEERREFASLSSRWHTMIRYASAQRGWAYDRLADLARILRIPGTQNCKDPVNPKNVVVHSFTGRMYNPSDFREYLEDMNIPDPEAEAKAALEWAEKFKDKPLAINLQARIPEELLKRWMDAAAVGAQTAMKFRNTWQRQRHDLADQSGSGYDLALACFGIDAGLDEQQIVDMIVHHRAMHAERPRKALDYFQRTISKATSRAGGIDPTKVVAAPAAAAPTSTAAAPEAAPVASGSPPANPDPPTAEDAAKARVQLCERISQMLGVRIILLVKITGKEPTYHMHLDSGVCIEYPSFAKFTDQAYVRNAIGSQVNRLIPKIKPKAWDQITQMMLDALFEEEGGEETDFKGATRLHVENYLSDTSLIPSVDGQPVQYARKPMVHNGRIAICASDLQSYINKTTFQSLTVKQVVSMLKALGATRDRVYGKNRKEQSRWLLPVEDFDPAEYREHEQERQEEPAHADE